MKKVLMITTLAMLVGVGVTGCGADDAAKKAVDGGAEMAENAGEGVLNVLDKAKDATKNAANSVKEGAEAVKDAGSAVVEAGENVVEAGKDVAGAAGNVAEGGLDAVKNAGENAVDAVKEGAEAVKDAGEKVVNVVEGKIAEEKMEDAIEDMEEAKEEMEEAKEEMKEAEEKMMDAEVSQDETAAALGVMYDGYSDAKLEELKASGEKFALFFHADWCPSCVALDKEIMANMADLPAKNLLKVDYDSSDELKRTYAVASQHTGVFFDGKGNTQTVPGVTLDDIKRRLQ